MSQRSSNTSEMCDYSAPRAAEFPTMTRRDHDEKASMDRFYLPVHLKLNWSDMHSMKDIHSHLYHKCLITTSAEMCVYVQYIFWVLKGYQPIYQYHNCFTSVYQYPTQKWILSTTLKRFKFTTVSPINSQHILTFEKLKPENFSHFHLKKTSLCRSTYCSSAK